MVGKGHYYKGKRISPLQFAMLILLKEKAMYGYELLKALRDEFEGVWTPQTGSVYPALKRLDEHGLVRSDMRDGTEYYSLTVEGEGFVAEGLMDFPGDIQFMSRYFQMIDRAATVMRGDKPTIRPHPFSQMFEQDRISTEERLRMLRSAREDLVSRLTAVQTELEELEEESKKGDA